MESNKEKLIPEYIWFNGEIIPWDKATVHIWSEVAIRGANVFDALRGYWNEEQQCYQIVALEQHVDRLMQSARLLKFTDVYSKAELIKGIRNLIQKLKYKDHVYIRPTIYIEKGGYSSELKKSNMGAYIVAFPTSTSLNSQKVIRCRISSYNRLSDNSLSPLIKTGAAYLSFRLPKIEAMESGFDDVIFLNADGSVSEAAGATVFIIKAGKIITPSLDSNILESITRNIVIRIAKHVLGIEVIERKILRTELYCAEEVFLCGTLSEILPIVNIDNFKIGTGEIGKYTKRILNEFYDLCINGIDKEGDLITIFESDKEEQNEE